MTRAVALLALITACAVPSPWPPFEDHAPLPHDPRFGFVVHEGPPGPRAQLVEVAFENELYVYVQGLSGPTGGLHVYQIDVDAHTARALPPPPGQGRFAYDLLGTSVDDEGCALWLLDQLQLWDGQAWTAVPVPTLPPTFDDEHWLARDGQVLLAGRFWDGTSWRGFPSPLVDADVRLGPWDARGFRLVYGGPALCTVLIDPVTLVAGAPSCLAPPSATRFERIGDPRNGLTDDFTVVAQLGGATARLYHFDGTTWTPRDVVTLDDDLWPAPRSPRPLLARAHMPYWSPELAGTERGVLGARALASFPIQTVCTCDRPTDAACPCYGSSAGNDIDTVVVASPERGKLALMTHRSIDNQNTVYVRILDLPVLASPFAEAFP